jgi:hypothetical protein
VPRDLRPGLGRGEHFREHVDAQVDPLGQRAVLPDLEQPLLRRGHHARMTGHPLHHPAGFTLEQLGGNHGIDEAEGGQRLHRVAVAGQDHLLGLGQPDVLLQQRDVAHRRHADLDLGQPEGGVGHRDADVGDEREAQPGAEAVAVDGRDGRERRGADRRQQPSVLHDELAGPRRREVREGGEVHAGRERPRPGAGEHRGARPVARLLEDLGEPVEVGEREGVAGLRPIEGDPPDAVLVPKLDRGPSQISLGHRRALLAHHVDAVPDGCGAGPS